MNWASRNKELPCPIQERKDSIDIASSLEADHVQAKEQGDVLIGASVLKC